MFPSGFLFINNVFYVDSREGCVDHSAGLRRWARARGLGAFPARDLAAARLQQLTLKLGHPDVSRPPPAASLAVKVPEMEFRPNLRRLSQRERGVPLRIFV